jgi:hypothetical protein
MGEPRLLRSLITARIHAASGDIAMPGPGEYLADETEGITRVEHLLTAQGICRSRNYKRRKGPRCGRRSYRLRRVARRLRDLGDLGSGRPPELHLTYSQHHGSGCRQYCNVDPADVALPRSHDTHRVVAVAGRLVVEDRLPYWVASWHLWRDHRVVVLFAIIQNWVEASGKNSGGTHGFGRLRMGSG